MFTVLPQSDTALLSCRHQVTLLFSHEETEAREDEKEDARGFKEVPFLPASPPQSGVTPTQTLSTQDTYLQDHVLVPARPHTWQKKNFPVLIHPLHRPLWCHWVTGFCVDGCNGGPAGKELFISSLC